MLWPSSAVAVVPELREGNHGSGKGVITELNRSPTCVVRSRRAAREKLQPNEGHFACAISLRRANSASCNLMIVEERDSPGVFTQNAVIAARMTNPLEILEAPAESGLDSARLESSQAPSCLTGDWPKYWFLQRDESSLASQRDSYFRAVAAELEAHPELLAIAQETNRHFLDECSSAGTRWANEEWEVILHSWSVERIAAFLRNPRADSRDIRLSAPFATILGEQEFRKTLQ